MRIGLVVVALLAVLAVDTARSSPFRTRTVPCDEVVDLTRFPYVGSAEPRYRDRVVLDQISVPPAYVPQTSPTDERPWAFFSKWGLVVRSNGVPVTITVPRDWRDRVAIVWGNGGHGVFQSVRLAGCNFGRNVGDAYAGGFFLRRASDCVPLVFRVGTRSAVVRFGIGRRCA